MTTDVAGRFRSVGDGFEVEYAGPVIRIWCGACDKHELLLDDHKATLDKRKTTHRCGERTSPWDRGDIGCRV